MTRNRGTHNRREPNPTLFSALLFTHARVFEGSQAEFAASLGVASQSITRWVMGDTFPPQEYMDRIAERVGVSSEVLSLLGEVSLANACEVVAERLVEDSPAGQERSAKQRAAGERFTEMVVERGGQLAPAAYVLYLSGDADSRVGLVSFLDQHVDRVPIDTPPEALQLMVDLSSETK
ncbi:MAG TPA: helix-turn-helix transcriptional regulator [Candidatus Saccharimonadales bacterium]